MTFRAGVELSHEREPHLPARAPVAGNNESTRPENRAFFPALDGLRAVAFLMVFFHHYRSVPWGWTGVDLFFVLSGFLITGILFDTRDTPHGARNFYIRRTLRIFPLYYGIMLALLISAPLLHWQGSWPWLVWPAYLGNLARFVHPYADGSPLQRLADFQLLVRLGRFSCMLFLGHFWSLCVEEQFYLIWPWIVFFVRDRGKLLWISTSTVPVCLAMRLAGQHLLPGWMLQNEILYRTIPFRFDALLLGGSLALWIRGPHAAVLLRVARAAFPIALCAALLCAIVIPGAHVLHSPYPYPDWKLTWGLTAVDLLAALALLAAIQPASLVYRALSLKPLRWLGRISYGAYVLHDIPHSIYARIGTHLLPAHGADVTAFIALVSTVALAWLSFRFFETPFLNLKERWTRQAP
jgi:peptidoglycan/LPS O-acetylase OafA/YrhL